MPATAGYVRIVTAPTSLPITVSEARQQLRIVNDDEDTLISSYLRACVDFLQDEVPGGMALLTTTYDFVMPHLSEHRIYLPYPPLQSVTFLKYYTEAGTLTTLFDSSSGPPVANTSCVVHMPATGKGWLQQLPNIDWPDTQDDRDDAVTVRFVAGYTPATMPHRAKQAIRLALGSFYEYRESTLSGTIVSEVPLSAQAMMKSLNYGSYV